MIDPQTINPLTLPSVSLNNKSQLPSTPCIYFAIDGSGVVQYIGQSANPALRWVKHHRHSLLAEMHCVRIAYLSVDADLLLRVERALIEYFEPPLNQLRGKTERHPSTDLRESLGLTQKQIADAVGVTDQTVSNWERGVHVPRLTLRQTVKLCHITNRSVEDLANLFEPEKNSD